MNTKRDIYRERGEDGLWVYWAIIDGRKCPLTRWWAHKNLDAGKYRLVVS